MAIDLQALHANYQPVEFGRPKAQEKKKGNFLTGLLPTIGGALGAVGGSFIAPVAGTAAGGAAGAALGEALRQRITGEKTSVGNIGKEAAFGAVPGVFKGAKAGVTAIKGARAAKEATAAERAAQQIAEQQRTASLGRATIGTALKSDASAVAGKAADAQRFNDLAAQNIQRLSKQNATQGLPLPGGGTLVRPGKAPSFASEGVELQPVPKAPAIPGRYKNVGDASTPKPTATDAYGVPLPEATQAASPAKQTLFGKLSTAATKRGSGIKTDPGVGGIERADEAAQAFQRMGISGTPTQQLRRVNEVMSSHGKQVDEILAKNPIQLDGTAVRSQVEKAVSDPLKYAELDLSTPGAQKALTAHLDKFAQAKTAKEVNDYVKVLNKVATRAKAKLDRGGTLTDKESAALAAKRSGDEVLSQYPEIAPFKKDMATLFERNADITKASEKTAGIPILGIKSRLLAQAGTNLASQAGAVGTKTATAAANPSVKRKVAGALFGQWGTRAVGEPLVSPDQMSVNNPMTQSTAQTANDTTMIPASNSTIDSLNPTGAPDASTTDIDYEAEARNALSQGDYKAFDAILSLAALAEKKAASGAKGLNSTASGVIADTKTGLNSLIDLSGKIGDSNANNPLIGQIRSKNPFDTNAQNLQASIATAKQIVGKALEGGVLRKEDEYKYAKILPTVGDTDAVAQHKIQELVNLISGRLTEYQNNISGGSGGTDLAGLGL